MHQQSHVICVQYGFCHLFCDAMGDIPHPTSHIKVEKMWSTAETVTSNLIPISSAASRWPWEIENKPSCWGFTTICDELLKQEHFRLSYLFLLPSGPFVHVWKWLCFKSDLLWFCLNVIKTILIHSKQDLSKTRVISFWRKPCSFSTLVIAIVLLYTC